MPDTFTWIGFGLAVYIMAGLFLVLAPLTVFLVVKTKHSVKIANEEEAKLEKYYPREYGFDDFGTGIASVLVGVAAVISLLFLVIEGVPYNPKYWGLYEVTGTVENVTNTFTAASGDITSEPVVTLSSVDDPVVVSNTRITQLVGQEVTLVCNIAWHYQARDTYSCAIRDIG